MADAIVILLLENLSQVLVKEASWLIGEDVKLPSLGGQLKEMAGFLENCKDLPDELNQIRDLAHNIEDIVDDCLIRTYKEKSKEKKNKESLLKYLPKLGRQLAEKDIVRKTMKDIKVKADDICDKIKKKPKEAVDAAAKAELTRCSRRSPIVEEADLVGITDDVNRLLKRIDGGMPNLERFVVDDCGCLEWLKGVHFLAKLQVLDLKKPTKMLRRRMQELNKETQLFQLQIYPLHEN